MWSLPGLSMRANGLFRNLLDTNGSDVVNTLTDNLPTSLGTSGCRGTVVRLNLPYPLEIASNISVAPARIGRTIAKARIILPNGPAQCARARTRPISLSRYRG